jgi:hypothetical protein
VAFLKIVSGTVLGIVGTNSGVAELFHHSDISLLQIIKCLGDPVLAANQPQFWLCFTGKPRIGARGGDAQDGRMVSNDGKWKLEQSIPNTSITDPLIVESKI